MLRQTRIMAQFEDRPLLKAQTAEMLSVRRSWCWPKLDRLRQACFTAQRIDRASKTGMLSTRSHRSQLRTA